MKIEWSPAARASARRYMEDQAGMPLLIIIEIKRPSHTLTVEDLNQLERYVVLCEQYDETHSSIEGILVGSKQADELRRTLKLRGTTFKVKTYTQLIGDTERRYSRYLEALDPEEMPVLPVADA